MASVIYRETTCDVCGAISREELHVGETWQRKQRKIWVRKDGLLKLTEIDICDSCLSKTVRLSFRDDHYELEDAHAEG